MTSEDIEHLRTCPSCLCKAILADCKQLGAEPEVISDACAMAWDAMKKAKVIYNQMNGIEEEQPTIQ